MDEFTRRVVLDEGIERARNGNKNDMSRVLRTAARWIQEGNPLPEPIAEFVSEVLFRVANGEKADKVFRQTPQAERTSKTWKRDRHIFVRVEELHAQVKCLETAIGLVAGEEHLSPERVHDIYYREQRGRFRERIKKLEE